MTTSVKCVVSRFHDHLHSKTTLLKNCTHNSDIGQPLWGVIHGTSQGGGVSLTLQGEECLINAQRILERGIDITQVLFFCVMNMNSLQIRQRTNYCALWYLYHLHCSSHHHHLRLVWMISLPYWTLFDLLLPMP